MTATVHILPYATQMVPGPQVFFQAHFDEELSFSNAPSIRRTSWGLPLLRVEKQEYKREDRLEFRLSAGELAARGTWHWSCGKVNKYP